MSTHVQGFWLLFVLAKLSTTSIRVKGSTKKSVKQSERNEFIWGKKKVILSKLHQMSCRIWYDRISCYCLCSLGTKCFREFGSFGRKHLGPNLGHATMKYIWKTSIPYYMYFILKNESRIAHNIMALSLKEVSFRQINR